MPATATGTCRERNATPTLGRGPPALSWSQASLAARRQTNQQREASRVPVKVEQWGAWGSFYGVRRAPPERVAAPAAGSLPQCPLTSHYLRWNRVQLETHIQYKCR